MPKISVQAGSTGVSVNLFIQSSTATDGSGKTGLVFNSAGLTCYSMRQRTTATPVTLATSTVGNPWITGGFIEINSTAANGWYNFDIPNAVLGTGSPFASVHFQGASGMAPLPLEIELTAWNNQDPSAGGMTQLSSTGTLGSVSNIRGTATVLLAPVVHTGAVVPIVQTASNVTVQGTATVILAAGVHTGAIVPIVQTASNLVNNADKTGYYLGTGTQVGVVIPQVNIVQTSADGRMANLDVAVSSRSTAGDAMTLTTGERTAVADRFLDRDMSSGTDSGSASVRTPRQALRQLRNKWQVSTGTLTVFREDDSTVSWTATISSTSSADAIIGSDPA